MAEVIEEIALVVIAVGIVHGALEGGGGVEVVTLEALASWEEERRLHVIDFKMQQMVRHFFVTFSTTSRGPMSRRAPCWGRIGGFSRQYNLYTVKQKISPMEKPLLDDSFLDQDLLFLHQDHLNNPEQQDIPQQASPDQDALSSTRRRNSKRSTLSEKGTRKRKKSEEQIKEQNHGHWLTQENKRYHWFLQVHYQHFVNSHMRRTDKIFKTMELFIGTRQAEQCRSHHQKMEKKYINFTNILIHFREENYHTIDPSPMRLQLEEENIEMPDGLANQQELATYRQMEEDARRKYGRKRMWRRNLPEKQPTPTTMPPEMPIEPPVQAVDFQEPSRSEEEGQRQMRSEGEGVQGAGIDMFKDESQNIGEISMINERQDLSCLFHSFLNH